MATNVVLFVVVHFVVIRFAIC